MQILKIMEAKKIFGFLVATIALAILLVAPVDAFAQILQLEVNGIETENVTGIMPIGVFAGETIPVRIVFKALEPVDDVKVFARIRTSGGFSDITERFDVLENSTYSKLLNVKLPFDIKPNERFDLIVEIESQGRSGVDRVIELEVQRASYEVEILSVESNTEVKAGETLILDVVLKNRGRHEAEDTFVIVSIPELGISKRVFFGDLSPEDQSDPDKEDSKERRIFLRIPSDTPVGVYNVEIEAFNTDASTLETKRVVVTAAGEDSRILSSVTSKSFAVNEEQTYSITIVNAGNNIKVYELVIDAPSGLTVEADESIVAVPAGSSRTVKLRVMASEEGNYDFSVNVHSDSELIKREGFTANVKGRAVVVGNAAVLLTVVLAIIFVVLLIVLIVLLTRKSEKTEETGESYY